MCKTAFLLFTMISTALVSGPTEGADEAGRRTLERTGTNLVDALVRGDFTAATKDLDNRMQQALPPDVLKPVWENLIAKAGDYRGRLGTYPGRIRDHEIVYVICRFERFVVDVKLVFDPQRKIAGLWFEEYSLPGYVDLESFEERPVTIGRAPWKLRGTLSVPKGAPPRGAVVLVHGSGPHNREETLGPNRPFRDLGWGLASAGIAVIRYDKRTLIYAHRLEAMKYVTPTEEVVTDALTAVGLLRSASGVDPGKVYVLGHSFGGAMVPMIGKQDPNLAGLISLGGPTRPLEDVLVEQTAYVVSLDGQVSPKEKGLLALQRKQTGRVKDPNLSPETPAMTLPFGIPGSYWLSLRGYHPGRAAKELNIPMLILHGGRDYQVTEVDLAGWKEHLSHRPNVTFKTYPGLNHLMIEGTGKPTPAEYSKPGHVADAVVKDIAAWILRSESKPPAPPHAASTGLTAPSLRAYRPGFPNADARVVRGLFALKNS